MERRAFLQGVGAAGGAAAATGTAAGVGGRPTDTSPLKGSVTARYAPQQDRFTFGFTYEVPTAVSDFVVDFGAYADWGTDLLASTTNLERQDTGSYRLRWTGEGSPAVSVHVPVEGDSVLDGVPGYGERGDAVVRTPLPELAIEADGAGVAADRSFTFDGKGHAAPAWTYAGSHKVGTRTADGTAIRLVVPEVIQDRIVEPGVILDHYAFAQTRLPARTDYDVVTAIVLPAFWLDGPLGYTVENGILITEQKAHISSTDTIPTREYARMLYGSFGDGKTRWLTDAVAKYYGIYIGHLFQQKLCRPFYDQVSATTDEDIVLADPEEVQRFDAGRSKGAHVLAALDVQIHERSGGDSGLVDVLASSSQDLTTYDGFRAAVVAAGDEALGKWLDEYVTTSAIPELNRVVDCTAAAIDRPSTATVTDSGGRIKGDAGSDPSGGQELVAGALALVVLGGVGSLVWGTVRERLNR